MGNASCARGLCRGSILVTHPIIAEARANLRRLEGLEAEIAERQNRDAFRLSTTPQPPRPAGPDQYHRALEQAIGRLLRREREARGAEVERLEARIRALEEELARGTRPGAHGDGGL